MPRDPKQSALSATSRVAPTRDLLILIGCAVALGVFGAFGGYVSLGAIKLGSRWNSDFRPGWFGGHWWWVAVTAAAGLAVGLLRRLTHLAEEIPDLFDDLRAERVDPKLVPATVAASAVSLIGGASVGPEKFLATMGGGAGGWLAERRRLGNADAQVIMLAGIAGIFGGLFSSPVIAAMLILEIVRPGGRRFSKILITDIVAGSISFGIYFAIAGAVFLGTYPVPQYRFEDWQLPAGVLLGMFAALVATATAGFIMLASWLFGRLQIPAAAKSVLGGVMFGAIGVALPLTMFSGGAQLTSVLNDANGLGLALCTAILLAKMAAYAISQGSGFVGGPIFPSLFVGGTAGIVVHEAVPALPLGLAFSCLVTAVLGSLAAAPFAMVLMAAILTRVGALQTSPILITVVTTFLGVEGVKYLVTTRFGGRAPAILASWASGSRWRE